mgnify:FL=1
MKIGDIVVPTQESVQGKNNMLMAERKYQVCRELGPDHFMIKDLVTGCYISGFVEDLMVIK